MEAAVPPLLRPDCGQADDARPLGEIVDRIMLEIAAALGWPTSEQAMRFYRLAEPLPPIELKAAVVDAGMSGELPAAEAQAILRALGLEHE